MTNQKLTPRHQQIARLMLTGTTQRQIAVEMQLSEGYISRLVNTERFQQHLNELEDKANFDATKFFQDKLETACNVVTGYLDDPQASPSTRLAAAKVVLKLGQQETKPGRSAPAFISFEERLMQAGLL